MAEDLSFARKASGLTRGLSTLDAFGLHFGNQDPLMVSWVVCMYLFALFPFANIWISLAIIVVTMGLANPVVWGVLSGSMPRSGGDYVYNTRILHPLVGMAASMGLVIGQSFWNLIQSQAVNDPGLVNLGSWMGWGGFTDFCLSTVGAVIITMIVFLVAFFTLSFGYKIYKSVTRPILFIGYVCALISLATPFFMGRAEFIDRWNSWAAQYGSLNYNDFLTTVEGAAGRSLAGSWNWSETLAACGGATFLLIVYIWSGSYVAGEVKRPTRSIFISLAWAEVAIIVPFMMIIGGLQTMADDRFLRAAGWNYMNGPVEGYKLPWSTSYMDLIFMGSGGSHLIAVLFTIAWVLLMMLVVIAPLAMIQRVLFAWSMDRMGPKFLSEVSPRYGTPVKNSAFLVGATALVTLIYIIWMRDVWAGFVAAGLMLVTVFGVTGLSATVFAYRKRAKTIWDTSPYRTYKFLGIPVITIAGAVYTAVVLWALWFTFVDKRTADITTKSAWGLVIIWGAGIAWYLVWKYRNKRADIDTNVTYGELPPE